MVKMWSLPDYLGELTALHFWFKLYSPPHHRHPKFKFLEWNVLYFFTRESVSHYRRPMRRCMRNKIVVFLAVIV